MEEWKSVLKRSQSLRSVNTSYDKPAYKHTRTLSRTVSVSELVERYQSATKDTSTTSKENDVIKEKPSVHENTAGTPTVNGLKYNTTPQLEPPKAREDKSEPSWLTTSLVRSKSTGSLQLNVNVSIEALKARFELGNKAENTLRVETDAKAFKDVKPVTNGEIKMLAKEQKAPTAPENPAKIAAKKVNAPQKVEMQILTERRKTTGSVETTATSEANEKRRIVADFRENSFVEEKEKLCVSVKALSALFLSKVAAEEEKQRVLTPDRDNSSETGRQVKPMRMAEDDKLKREDHHRLRPEDSPETQSQQFQTFKENLHHQRQKCELRRLLKHTHPELMMSDDVVDEELAEVLSSESEVTADETRYEGEVRSRCLIFENSFQRDEVSACIPRMPLTEELIERGRVGKTSAVFEGPGQRFDLDQTTADSTNPSNECEEDEKRINVHETRRIFECVDTSQPSSEKSQVKVSTPSILTGLAQKQEREKRDQQNLQHKDKANNINWKEQLEQGSCNAGHSTEMRDTLLPSLQVQEEHQQSIKTSASLMQNNPFIAKNIEHSYAQMTTPQITPEADDTAKVKKRTHMFESMPFDKIKQQNKDQVETMVETLKESLTSLHQFNVIRADGAIIEVNETMRAKKAKYTLSESAATIKYDEVSEGNFQNFLLQLLPRANLRPQVTYLMEAYNGSINSTLVNVPVHQHQFTGTQDLECNTINVVQVVEDILNQDNSLRKGAIIQETDEKSADVVIYSLYKFSDEKDLRRYCPQDYLVKTDEKKSPSISADTPCQGSVNREETMKGNVKLFRSCIEKGDLEYLKTLQAKSMSEEQEGSLKQTMGQCTGIDPEQRRGLDDDGTPELATVDVKSLRNMFSEDQRQSQSNFTAGSSSNSLIGPNVTFENIQSSTKKDNDVSSEIHEDKLLQFSSQSQESINAPMLEKIGTLCGNKAQADLIKVVDDNEMSNPETATNSIQADTMEAQSLHQLSQEKHNSKSVESTEKPEISAPDTNSQLKQKEDNTPPQKSKKSEEHETQQEEEVVFEGKLKAALDSLERSNINVTRGDFKAAMIYRNASRPPKERPKTAGKEERDVESQRKLSSELQKPREQQMAVERSDRDQQQVDIKSLENVSQDILIIKKTCEEDHRDCNETSKTLGGTNDLSKMRPPMKPKRVKISQNDYKMSDISTQVGSEPQSPLVSSQLEQKDDKHGQGNKEEGKVELRAKRGRMETEDERRQRLSIHMDEIMRGNIGAAMEIFDNLRKQEELRVILSRVEEIEQDTSKVDVRSLRNAFEEVPDWVVSPNKKKPKQEKKTERKQETTPLSASVNKSSMAHIFGDLERASEEIITLKEQTLARLIDIEEAIKKALYSVSSLKSESDIAGLSSLFQESLGSVQGSSVPGNISKISIGSSKTKSLHVTEGATALSSGQNTNTAITPRPREGLPCSPAFISIESVAKKSDKPEPVPQEDTICPTYQHSPQKYCSTKTVECNSPALNRKKPNGSYPQREISVLEVQTDTDGSRISCAKTVKENYERLDAHGNRIYSSTTSTFVTTPPETTMTSTEMIVTRPFLHHVTTYPEMLLPVKPNP
ncbi:uncharacterized protein LOC144092127 [Stigmatopora argus]